MTVLLIRKRAKDIAGEFYEEGSSNWDDLGWQNSVWWRREIEAGRIDAAMMPTEAQTANMRARSKIFRETYPSVKDYLRGYQRMSPNFIPPTDIDGKPLRSYFRVEHSDRWWKIDTPGWMTHVETARQQLAQMLNMSDGVVTPHEKRVISDALIEDYNRSVGSPNASNVHQRLTSNLLH